MCTIIFLILGGNSTYFSCGLNTGYLSCGAPQLLSIFGMSWVPTSRGACGKNSAEEEIKQKRTDSRTHMC